MLVIYVKMFIDVYNRQNYEFTFVFINSWIERTQITRFVFYVIDIRSARYYGINGNLGKFCPVFGN